MAICFVSLSLFNTWQKQHISAKPDVNVSDDLQLINSSIKNNSEKNAAQVDGAVADIANTQEKLQEIPEERLIEVVTDVYRLLIDKQGGDIVSLELLDYPVSADNKEQGFMLLDKSSKRDFIVQSGLLNEAGPDSVVNGKAIYQANSKYVQEAGKPLMVDMFFTTKNGVEVTKTYMFMPKKYEVSLSYIISNNSTKDYIANMFGRLKRKKNTEKKSMFGGSRSFTGGAISTPESKYKKISFDNMKNKKLNQTATGGWIAMIEHYFTTAWIPGDNEVTYLSEDMGADYYALSFLRNPEKVSPGETKVLKATLFAGPEVADILRQAAPGLELTIDYGILWFISEPIFWIMRHIESWVHNWGIAIILTTALIKLMFFKLSAASYKSMGNMKKLQPRIEKLKERYADDQPKFGQALMEMYKQEKVNPLGGCLPMLVQIPVFIALYFMLLESVELRLAPFGLWVNDLSSKDPYYILPIIMGISMLLQQRLNPTPPDPIQAKVMMVMPIFFTFLFLSFPSGLVLYWVVNNLLSIAQQWYITRNFNNE